MKRRLISVILFAVLAALLSSTIIYRMISGNSPRTVKTATAPVVVAAKDLDAGVTVGDGDIQTMEWPVVAGTPWIGQRDQVVGRVLAAAVAKGEPFSESRLAEKGSSGGLAATIPPGMRLVAVHVDELTGLSRFIYPGMHVDVISTGPSGNPGVPGVVSRTILQNLEVFSSGDGARDPKQRTPPPPVFNLLVTPQQAEVLSQAVAQSRIQLALRNPMDKGSITSEVGYQPATAAPKPSAKPRPRTKPEEPKPTIAKAPPPPPAPAPTVEVIQGAKRVVSTVAPSVPPATPEDNK